ncbi:MAG: hypothetical protein WC741_01730 [Patescibacteria group bacterium]|jgi:hypothetical protein
MLPFLKPALNTLKKVLLVIVVYFAVISIFSHFFIKDKAALLSKTNPILENRVEIYKVINDKELNKTQQGKITIAIYRGMMCSMMGEACTNNPNDGNKNFDKSVLGFISNLITLPFTNPPASGIAWTYSGLANAGFFPKALAAEGIGMGSIQPFAKIWIIFRDVTYLLLVIVLVAIGFMVMFRTKINPQTVISVENSLPKIIISLILITFSFAIAGFMIDLMYVLIAIIVSILGPVYKGGSIPVIDLQKRYLQANLGTLYEGIGNENIWGSVLWNLPAAILKLIPLIGIFVRGIGGFFLLVISLPAIQFLLAPTKSIITDLAKSFDLAGEPAGVGIRFKLEHFIDFLGAPVAYPALIIAFFIFAIAGVNFILGILIWLSLVFIFFRIFLILISSYIKVLLNVILSPMYLLFEAVPGQSAFVNWLKNLTGELITFPLVVGIFLLGSIIVDNASSGTLLQFPFLIGIDPKSFGLIVGMLLLYMTPDLVKAVRQIFIPKPGILDGASPAVLFGGVGAATGGAMGAMGQFGSISLALGALGPNGVFAKLGQKIPFMERLVGPYGKEQKASNQ